MPVSGTGQVRYSQSINRVRHIVVHVSRFHEGTILSTCCGVTVDNVNDDLVSRPDRNCDECIPFRRTA